MSILNRDILVYAPMRDGEKHLAIIKGFPAYFLAETAIGAVRAASDFRLIQSEKLMGKNFPDDLREKLAASIERIKSSKS